MIGLQHTLTMQDFQKLLNECIFGQGFPPSPEPLGAEFGLIWNTLNGTPNHYIIFVAPPGIVSKSTTVAIAMDLLRKVPGIQFGPEIVTWPALVTAFATASEAFEVGGEWITQCALTLESSEFGNLIDPTDRGMIDLLVTLWDSKSGALKKATKSSGNDSLENPWINLIACTTPAWIAGNFPEYVIGGGFTSRCLFVYTDKKERLVAYPHQHVPQGMEEMRQALISDLTHIATNLIGPYNLTPDALEWGEAWYEHHYNNTPAHLSDERFGGYLARKQTHLHKLAMILTAAHRDEMVISSTELQLANTMITELEQDMPKVFAKIGRSENSIQAERFIKYVQKNGPLTYRDAFRNAHTSFPDMYAFTQMLQAALQSGQLDQETIGGVMYIKAGMV